MNNKVKKEAADILRNLGAVRVAAECMRLCGDDVRAEALEAKVRAADLALGDLHPDDRYLLAQFYTERKAGFMARLCEYFGCGASTVYRKKRRAVAEFAMRMFGCAGDVWIDVNPASAILGNSVIISVYFQSKQCSIVPS